MKRLRWFPSSLASLLLLLQRTPVLRVAAEAGELAGSSRAVSLLKSAFTAAASLGAVHSLAGATQFSVSNANVSGTVGTAITAVAFTVTGAPTTAGSFRVTGTLPPGVTLIGANANGVANGSTGTLRGTPAAAGSYSASIYAYEFTNASGDAFGPTVIRFTIAAAPNVAPAITAQPIAKAATAGETVTFTASASGSPAPSYQWRKDGADIANATSASLTLANLQVGDAGSYSVFVSNSVGNVTSNAVPLTVSPLVTGPTFTQQPSSQHVSPGTTVTFTASASGNAVAYQWKKDGVPISGATNSNLVVSGTNAGSMGFYAVTASDNSGSTDSTVAILTVATGGTSRLTNVSTRGYLSPGAALTPGFVLKGTGSKALVIRAVGPALANFGLSGVLADPRMEIIPLGGSAAIASNDNWGGSTQLAASFAAVGAFPLTPATSKDASVVGALNSTGVTGYTVRITSNTAGAAGLALAEVYDEDPITAPLRLVNVSTLGFVGSGEQALVPGFYISGDAPKRLLIRAVGPGLAQYGVTDAIANPELSVIPLGKAFAVASNDNWGGTAELRAAFSQAAAFDLAGASNDAAVVVQLPPGGYTVVVSGVANGTGSGLVEIYDLDP